MYRPLPIDNNVYFISEVPNALQTDQRKQTLITAGTSQITEFQTFNSSYLYLGFVQSQRSETPIEIISRETDERPDAKVQWKGRSTLLIKTAFKFCEQ